jgi:peptidyl-prolyl cis-trans isomerase SurA
MKNRVVGLTLVGLLLALSSMRADILEQVLVKVNGDIITKSDLEQRQIAAVRQLQPNLRANDDAGLQKALSEVTPQVIVDAIDELLMVQRGRELGYTMSTEQFNGIVENIKKENKIETDAALEAALKQEGMTMADLRKQLERQMLMSRVRQTEIAGKLQVTDAEVKMYYDANQSAFATSPQITLREILITVPVNKQGVNVAQDDEARAKAEDVRKRLLAGEPFPRLAADFSDSPSKANGGLVGPLSRTDLSEELQKAIQNLKAGDLTPVLRTERGYQVIKVESASESTIKPFEEAKAEISDRLANDKSRGEVQKYLTKLRDEAIIDWKNDEIKKAYEVGLKQPRREG